MHACLKRLLCIKIKLDSQMAIREYDQEMPHSQTADQLQGRSHILYHVEAHKMENSEISDLVALLFRHGTTKALIRLRGCAGWSAPLLFTSNKSQDIQDVEARAS